jgi:hypothetical protein
VPWDSLAPFGSLVDGNISRFIEIDHPFRLAVEDSGNLYVLQSTNNMVIQVAPDATLVPAAGDGHSGFPAME